MADEQATEEKKEEVSEEQERVEKEDMTIFDETKVAGIVVKPWSFGTLFEISPFLDSVLEKAEKNGLIQDLESIEDRLSAHVVAKIFTTASDEVLAILRLTTGVDEVTIKNLSMQDGVTLVTAIYNQNKETIKNALAPLFLPMM